MNEPATYITPRAQAVPIELLHKAADHIGPPWKTDYVLHNVPLYLGDFHGKPITYKAPVVRVSIRQRDNGDFDVDATYNLPGHFSDTHAPESQ